MDASLSRFGWQWGRISLMGSRWSVVGSRAAINASADIAMTRPETKVGDQWSGRAHLIVRSGGAAHKLKSAASLESQRA